MTADGTIGDEVVGEEKKILGVPRSVWTVLYQYESWALNT